MSNAGESISTCYGPVSADVMARAKNIRLLILDVDGVMSDGLIYMGNNGEELKAFNAVSYTHLTLPTKSDECRSRWSPYH